MSLRVEAYIGDARSWDGFVRAQPGWSHFHLLGWRAVMQRAFGHECLYFAARLDDGALAGVMPLVRVKSLLFGHYLVSMPFVNYGGPLGTEAAVERLVSSAVDLAREGDVKLLELRCRRPASISLPVSHRKITVVLDLPADPETLWRRLEPKVRSQIRRPRKDGVEMRFGLDQVDAFYRVFARHMRDLGTPVLPKALFDCVAEEFPDDIRVGCAYLGDEAIAAGWGFRWGDELEMTWAAALVRHKRAAANMLLYWSFMERAMAEGVTLFNFGRCSRGGGTHRFKLQWGSREEPLWWYGAARGKSRSTPSPTDGAYAWGPRLWKHLPTPIATVLGPRIVRNIP